jgi:uncharacterized membrane protein
MNSRHIFWFVLLVAGGICALIISPAVESMLGGSGVMGAFARLAFYKLCHQLPERCLWLGGVCLPVCARCAGIFAGFFLGWLIWRFFPEERRDRPVSNLVLIIGLGPMVVDGLMNTLGLVSSPGLIRFGAGLLFGSTAARALWPAILAAGSVMEEVLYGGRAVDNSARRNST